MADISSAISSLDPKLKSESISKVKEAKSNLDKNAFLNLLVTQMKYQDPMNPTNDKDFLAQMAQFSSLEQMQNINKSSQLSQGYSLIDKYVSANHYDDISKTNKLVEGKVEGVKLKNGNVYLTVSGADVELESVQIIDNRYNNSSDFNKKVAEATALIGKNIIAKQKNSETGKETEIKGLVAEVKVSQNKILFVVDGKEVREEEITNIDNKALESLQVTDTDSLLKIKDALTKTNTSETEKTEEK